MSTQSLKEIGQFLIPIQLDPLSIEWLPLVFFIVIWGLFSFTIWHVRKNATPAKWENNWHGGNKKDRSGDLDAEHGSVMEISDAVATPAEKWADIMPGMILIIGLLGTFLSLGLALDKASLILTQVDGSSMDSSMSNLMGMMQGLGTKFKTSTWALLAFIALKIILSRNGYDEQRLRWSIRKVKKELDNIREQKINVEQKKSQQLISSIQLVADQFQKTLQESHQDQKILLTSLGQQNKELIETIKGNHTESLRSLKDSANQNLATRKAMEQFVQTNLETVETLGKSAVGMSNAAVKMGESANELQNVIDSFRNNMETVVSMMKDDLNTTITGMNDSFKTNMETMSHGLGIATKDISSAVNSLSKNVDHTMRDVSETIGKSMEMQSKSVQGFEVMSNSLIEQVEGMTNLINKLSGDIQGGLSAISASNREVINLTKSLNIREEKFDDLIEGIQPIVSLTIGLDQLIKAANERQIILKTIAENTAKNFSNKPRAFGFKDLLGDNSNER